VNASLVLTTDARRVLVEVRCPPLNVGGRHDLVVPAAAGRSLARLIRTAEWSVLAGGHIAHLSRPAHSEPILSAWLGRLVLSGAADFEGAERLDGFVPIDMDVADERPRRSVVAPADHILDSPARPPEKSLDAT